MKYNLKDYLIFIIFILLFTVSFCFSDSNSFAAFQTQSMVTDVNVKKWSVKVNGTNIVYRNKFRFDAVYNSDNASTYVKDGVIAPGATFDVPILIDASKSEIDVEYKFGIDSSNTQFTIVDTSPARKEVTAGTTQNAVVTIRWDGTGNTSDDLSLQGKNIDIPLNVYTRQLIN